MVGGPPSCFGVAKLNLKAIGHVLSGWWFQPYLVANTK